MAIQNDNTLVTKGDLKELYTDKIAPYLGGGISYYHTDRTGEELKSCYASLGSAWAATANTNVPFIKRTGEFIQPSTGLFTIPNGTKIEVIYTFGGNPGGDSTFGLYNNTDSLWITADGADLKMIDPFIQSGYNYGSVFQVIWKNETGHDVDVAIRCNGTAQSTTLAVDRNALTIKEIGRIVDPVKYVSNNSDLQETPVGNIISYMGNSVPKHYLACDGTLYNIGTYPELEAFIIDEFGSINYFGGDGSSTWAVPDLRGEFLRGTGTNGHTNQGDGANVGVHQHSTLIPNLLSGSDRISMLKNASSQYPDRTSGNSKLSYGNLTGTTSGEYSQYYTIRPTNTSVKYCIKYESTYHAFFSNAAYKVETSLSDGGTKAWNNYGGDNSGQICTPTLLEGDSSLIDAINKCFIVPIDGWYNISAIIPYSQKTPSNKSGWIMFFDISDNNKKIGLTNTLQSDNTANTVSADGEWGHMYCSGTFYLEKGHQIQIGAWRSANDLKFTNAKASFCLLTSNYNPTIVSADSVYSENEQMIGYWKDGKPLYQKTYIGNTPSSSGGVLCSISSLDTLVWAGGTVKYSNGNTIIVPQLTTEIFRSGTTNNILFAGSSDGWFNRPCYITFQYTKTTDTASSLQIENSLLLNRPDLWEVGTEYHFGGGLYGKRIEVAPFSSSSKAEKNVAIATGVSKIINYGGEVYNITENWQQVVGTYRNVRTTADNDYSALYYIDNNSLIFWFSNDSNTQTFNFSIDTWVLYKK